MQTAEKKIKKFGSNLQSIGGKMTAGVTVPFIAAAGVAFKSASDMDEALNKVNVAFAGNAKEVTEWGKTTLKNFGIAKGTALDMAALFGDMATGMGMGTEEASKMSMQLVGLAADLASFKNIGIDEAQSALKGIFTGETESLKNLGIVMTQANLDAFAMANGFGKVTKEMTETEKIQLRLAFVFDKTKNAQGDFARTSSGASNQMRIFTESLKELSATFGEVLLPLLTPILTKINEMIQKFGAMDDKTKKIIVTIAAFAAAVGPLLMVTGSLLTNVTVITKAVAFLAVKFGILGGATAGVTAASTGATVATTALGVSFSAMLGPILAVVAAVGLFALGVKHAIPYAKELRNEGTLAGQALAAGSKNGFVRNTYNAPAIKNTTSATSAFDAKMAAKSGKLESYAIGTNYVPSDGLAYLHKGEAVIPADQNKGFGGGVIVNVTGNTILNDRDADRLGDTIVRRLKLAGVKV